MKKKPLISIICPVHNEQESVPVFYSRLQNAIAPVKKEFDFELIFINDSSTDATLSVIKQLRKKDPATQVLSLSRNFGYQASVLAGMKFARGNGIFTIDVDCEDPPELVPEFISKWKEGYDVVYGLREGRPEAKIITSMRRLFYRSLKIMADSDIVLDMAEFALISSRVRDIIIDNQNTFPFLRAEIGYAGFSRIGIKYDRQSRVRGKSHYNIWRMTVFAGGGILTSSTFPMRIAFYFLPLFITLNILLLVLDLFNSTIGLFKVLLVFDVVYGASLLTVNGLYFARIYKNSISRPVFIIDWRNSHHNLPDSAIKELMR
ncbi:MAG TPA: glycosyltransferase family 2 protein [Bacteroidota bacterium]|nr:glycosyltransferase family 2 protein [Bacteroidota bacterium]